MDLKLSIRLNEKLFLRDPESSELGRRIMKHGIELIHKLGFEAFTFKKLAEEIKKLMFVFDDIVKIDDKGIHEPRTLLRQSVEVRGRVHL